MSNERLLSAMHDAGIDAGQLADAVQVDAKTIARWVSGRTPHPRHRAHAARVLGVTAHELWPDAQTPTPSPDDPPAIADGFGDVDAVHPAGADPDALTVSDLIRSASARIDLLDLTLHNALADPEIRTLLTARADVGAQVRLLISDPESAYLLAVEHERGHRTGFAERPALTWEVQRTLGYLQPLLEHPNIQARTFVATPGCAITRGDKQMLICLHLYGAPHHAEPILTLTHRSRTGVFARYAEHFNLIWQRAAQPVVADPERYPDPDQHPDRYTPMSGQSVERAVAFGPTYDAGEQQVSSRSSIAPTSWLRRRR